MFSGESIMRKLAFILLLAFLTFGCTNSDALKEGAEKRVRKGEYPSLPAAVLTAEHKGLDGGIIKLEDYKGKVIVVNLWATWCTPCRKEIPVLIELQEKYRDKGLVVIGLDVDEESEQVVREFAKVTGINYTLGWINGENQKELLKVSRFEGVPQSFLIGRDGELMSVFVGGSQETVSKLREFVGRAVEE